MNKASKHSKLFQMKLQMPNSAYVPALLKMYIIVVWSEDPCGLGLFSYAPISIKGLNVLTSIGSWAKGHKVKGHRLRLKWEGAGQI